MAKTRTVKGLSAPSLLRYFRRRGRLMLAEHDGDLWVTDSYMAVRLIGTDNAVASLLALYNLPFEAMVCDVDSTVVRREGAQTPDIGRLIPAIDVLTPATRFHIGNAPALVEGSGSSPLHELWTAGKTQFCMNPDVVKIVNLFVGGDWFAYTEQTSTRPIAKARDGAVQAIAMPIRNLSIIANEEQAA